jgi:hypothetical protein
MKTLLGHENIWTRLFGHENIWKRLFGHENTWKPCLVIKIFINPAWS